MTPIGSLVVFVYRANDSLFIGVAAVITALSQTGVEAVLPAIMSNLSNCSAKWASYSLLGGLLRSFRRF